MSQISAGLCTRCTHANAFLDSRFQIQIDGRIGTRSILISYTQVLIVLVLDSVVKKIKALSIFTNVIVLKLLKGTTQTNTPNRNPMAKYSEVHEYVIRVSCLELLSVCD